MRRALLTAAVLAGAVASASPASAVTSPSDTTPDTTSTVAAAPAAPPDKAAGKPASADTAVTDTGEILASTSSALTASESSPSKGSGDLRSSRGVNRDPSAGGGRFKGVGAESILGTDNRFKVTDTTAYPARATVRITSSHGQCTGWMVDDDTVATAGHCLHDGSAWASNVTVTPGQNGTYKPYGSCGARGLRSVLGWTRDRDSEHDYGAIKLNCTIGNTVGFYGLRWTAASLNGITSYNRGYSGDKPAEQWMSSGSVRRSETRKLYYTNDTVGGNSGGPIYDYVNGAGPYGIAVHAYGTNDGGLTNSGTRITSDVFNNYDTWKVQ